MLTTPNITTLNQTWTTESGFDFTSIDIGWNSWGTLNETKDNVILIFHALTGDSNAEKWFSGLFAENGIIDLDKHFVICINHLGSCYGSTGPTSINPISGKAYQADFPTVTIRDIVRFQATLLDFLNIKGVELVLGGSMGGMVALEFSIIDERVKTACFIAMGKSHSPWAIGISHAQRQAIYADEHWKDGFYNLDLPPNKGLAAARAMAMITYRSAQNYETKFGRTYNSSKNIYEVESYLEYQGEKLTHRFDANSYVRLTQTMDTHDVSRGRGTFKKALAQLKIPSLVIGVDSDLLYPIYEQKELASLIPNSVYKEINSPHGHDAFLIEFDQINSHLISFLNTFSTF